jgi:hypothetical protein
VLAGQSHPQAQSVLSEEFRNAIGQCGRIARWEKKACVGPNDFWQATVVGTDNRFTTRLRLKRSHSEHFLGSRRHDEDVAHVVYGWEFIFVHWGNVNYPGFSG